MMNTIFRLLLTFNATSLLVLIFLVQKGYALAHFFPNQVGALRALVSRGGCSWGASCDTPNWISYILYLCVPIFLTGFSVFLSRRLGKDEFEAGDIVAVEHANNSFLPSYLGYFFVALSIDNGETLFFVYGVLFIFTFLSQALYFNPLFLIFGFEFYNVTTKKGATLFLISRQKYKTPSEIVIKSVSRINNYTFIERGSV